MATESDDASQVRWLRALVAALLVQILALYWPLPLSLPFSMPDPTSGVPADKLIHIALFAVPACCGVRLAQITGRRQIAVVVLAGLIVHAGVSELIQGAFLSRQRDLVDATADAVGIFIGVVWAHLRRRR